MLLKNNQNLSENILDEVFCPTFYLPRSFALTVCPFNPMIREKDIKEVQIDKDFAEELKKSIDKAPLQRL